MVSEHQQVFGAQWHSPERREVLKGLSAAVLASSGLLQPVFGKVAAIEARAASAAIDKSQGLTWLPAWQLREMIVKREVSAVEVVQHFLGRIEDLASKLNAFRKLDVQGAREQAVLADKAVKAGGTLGPLHGVPIAFKELFFVKGFPVPGSYFSYLEGEKQQEQPIATRDDIEVERLRMAGAIIVGITVAGLGPRPGMSPAQLPRNPWDISHTSGGSSSGNGAAVAGGLLPMAIGDDGGGSVRVPSAFCGLVGLHPTRGRIPHVDYKSLAPRPTVTVGPMTRSVRDAAIALQVLAGPDGRDYVCLPDTPPDYMATLESGIEGMRFAWTNDFGYSTMPDALRAPQVVSAIESSTDALKQVGADVSKTSMVWENPVPSWLATQQLMSGGTAGLSQEAFSESEIVAALASRQRNWHRFRDTFTKFDFIINPTVPFTAPKIDVWVEMCKPEGGHPKHPLIIDAVAAHTMMCNVLGLPAISIPAGFVNRLPVGLQVIGKPGSEADLLRVAQAFLAARKDA